MRCQCTHDEAFHEIGKRGGQSVRTYCSASTCDCARFEPDIAALPTRCETCGASMSPEEARRKRERDG